MRDWPGRSPGAERPGRPGGWIFDINAESGKRKARKRKLGRKDGRFRALGKDGRSQKFRRRWHFGATSQSRRNAADRGILMSPPTTTDGGGSPAHHALDGGRQGVGGLNRIALPAESNPIRPLKVNVWARYAAPDGAWECIWGWVLQIYRSAGAGEATAVGFKTGGEAAWTVKPSPAESR